MYKNFLMILVAATVLMSCGQNTASQDEQTAQEEVVVIEPTIIALADFSEKAGALVGQEVVLEGSVIHVCKHGGKKMFITADDPDVRIKITTGEETVSFDTELEGSYIKVHGIVEAIEEEIVDEGELDEEGEHEEDADHKNIYHAPQYSVICVEYTVTETTPEEK
jgi:hypothetical protein